MPSASLGAGSVSIVPFQPHHLTSRYVGWLNDAEVVRYSEQRHKTHTLESCAAYAASFKGGLNRLWAIETTVYGHVGNISATIDIPNRVADLAIVVGEKRVQGQGVGTAAWNSAMRQLYEEFGMRKITAGTMSENRAMMAIFDKSGMEIEGRRKAQFILDGRPVDLILAAKMSSQVTT